MESESESRQACWLFVSRERIERKPKVWKFPLDGLLSDKFYVWITHASKSKLCYTCSYHDVITVLHGNYANLLVAEFIVRQSPVRIFIIMAFCWLALFGQGKEPEWHWKSDSGLLQAEARFASPDTPRQIYIWESSSPESKQLFYAFERDATLLFSPDDQWIALNDHVGSGQSEIKLFNRIQGARFKASNLDPTGKCWALLKQQTKTPYPNMLFHTYACVMNWSANSQVLLVSLSGHNDPKHHIDNWLCVFDTRSGKASLNLDLMNRGVVHFESRP